MLVPHVHTYMQLVLFIPQDAIDVFLGNYTIDRWESRSLLQVQRSWRFRLVSIFNSAFDNVWSWRFRLVCVFI